MLEHASIVKMQPWYVFCLCLVSSDEVIKAIKAAINTDEDSILGYEKSYFAPYILLPTQ